MSDKHISQVQLLLHGEGSDGSTPFTDSSGAARTVTANGNVQIDTAQFKWGAASMLFDGNGDYLSIADAAALEFGNGDFTIETWIRASTFVGGFRVASKFVTTLNQRSWAFSMGPTAVNFFYTTAGTAVFNATTSVISTNPVDTWLHIAVTRAGSTIRTWRNGILACTPFNCGTDTIFNGTAPIEIGRINETPTFGYFTGHMDDFRITVGRARYTANFVPPQGPFNDNKRTGIARDNKPPLLMVR